MLHDQFCRSALPAALLALLVWGGCDNTLDPFAERGSFSIYGYLTVHQKRHFIRIKDLNDPLLGDSTRTLDATVTLENLEDGTTKTLKDSVVAFEGIFTHNFWADMAVHPQTKYRITVERSDGAITQATTTTPRITTASVTPQEGDCLTPFVVTLQDATELRRTRAAVGFRHGGRIVWISQNERISKQNAGKDHGPPHGSSAHFAFTPESVLAEEIESVDDPNTPVIEPRCWELGDDKIYIMHTHLGPDWFGALPDGDIGFTPTESRFVDNGLGFFGALYRDTLSVTVDTSDVIFPEL